MYTHPVQGLASLRTLDYNSGGPAVAAISTTDVQHMVDSLPGESSALLPDKWLVDSGTDVNIWFQL